MRTLLVLLAALATAAVCAGAGWGASGYDPAADPYSMANVTAQTGVQTWWDAGYTGQGVDVAVIDSGVSPVQGASTRRARWSTGPTSRSSRSRRTSAPTTPTATALSWPA